MIKHYDCCVIGGGLLARLWASQLVKHGRSTAIFLGQETKRSAPPYLALSAKSVSVLETFGLSVPGVSIDYLSLYQEPGQHLQTWGQGLGLHVARSDLEEQLVCNEHTEIKNYVLKIDHDQQYFHIEGAAGEKIRARLCFDFSGLSSPLRFFWQRPFAYLKLEAFQARIFKGQFPELKKHVAYQFKTSDSIWAFLPLEAEHHYVVQTWAPNNKKAAERELPIAGDQRLLAFLPPQALATIQQPYGRFGALLGSSAYLGHPNVASTFNIGLWQLSLMSSLLIDKKEEILLFNDFNQSFASKVSWLHKISSILPSSLRPLIALSPHCLSKLLIESLS